MHLIAAINRGDQRTLRNFTDVDRSLGERKTCEGAHLDASMARKPTQLGLPQRITTWLPFCRTPALTPGVQCPEWTSRPERCGSSGMRQEC